jgi:hypothetical protein
VWQSALTQMFHVPEHAVMHRVLPSNVPWERTDSGLKYGKATPNEAAGQAQY